MGAPVCGADGRPPRTLEAQVTLNVRFAFRPGELYVYLPFRRSRFQVVFPVPRGLVVREIPGPTRRNACRFEVSVTITEYFPALSRVTSFPS